MNTFFSAVHNTAPSAVLKENHVKPNVANED